jgi:hypothetical protein
MPFWHASADKAGKWGSHGDRLGRCQPAIAPEFFSAVSFTDSPIRFAPSSTSAIVRVVFRNRPAMPDGRRRQRFTMRDADPYARRRAEDVYLFVRPRCWGGLSGNMHRPSGHR